MNFQINDLEAYVEDELIEMAENYLAANPDFRPSEILKNLWAYSFIQNEPPLEAEIQLQNKKLKAKTCECLRFRELGMCEHVVIILMWIRRRIKKETEKKKLSPSSVPKPRPSSRLTVRSVLNNTNHQDLKSFVRQYARGNQEFALQLKARFAEAIPHLDLTDKYCQLFDAAIKPNKKVNLLTSKKNYRQLLMVGSEVLSQAERALINNNYKDAQDMAMVVILKLAPWGKLDNETYRKINELIARTFEIFSCVLEGNTAPQLKTDLWVFLFGEWSQTEKYAAHLCPQFIRLLVKLADHEDKKQQLIVLIDQYFQHGTFGQRLQITLVIAQLELLQNLGQSRQVNELLQKHLNQPEILLLAMEQAKDRGQWKRLETLAAYGQQLEAPNGLGRRIEEILLEKAQLQQDHQREKTLSRALFLKSYEPKFYRLFKKHSSSLELIALIKALQQQPFSIAQRDATAFVLEDMEDKDGLLRYLQDTQSLDLLRSYGHKLFGHNKAAIYQLYRQMMDDYLKSHLGQQAAIKTGTIFQHLKEIRALDLVEELLGKYRALYSDRNSLIEELDRF